MESNKASRWGTPSKIYNPTNPTYLPTCYLPTDLTYLLHLPAKPYG